MGTKSEEKETNTQINGLDHNKKINIQAEQNEERRIQKHEERLRKIQDNFEHSIIQIIGVSEEKRNSKELKTYFKNE